MKVPFMLGEVVIVHHRRWDEVTILIILFVKVVVPDSMDVEKGVRINFLQVGDSWIIHIGGRGEQFVIHHVELRQNMPSLDISNSPNAASVFAGNY